jgi:hypothetical protein
MRRIHAGRVPIAINIGIGYRGRMRIGKAIRLMRILIVL